MQPIWQRNVPVSMVREPLAGFPVHRPPGGFQVRAYQPGDEGHWLELHAVADKFNHFTDQSFAENFASLAQELPERQFYAVNDRNEVVGTATAWRSDRWGKAAGQVHWVAVHPQCQGRGVGKTLLTAVLSRLEEFGETAAYLSTSTIRPDALHLYLTFGFLPVFQSAEDSQTWAAMAIAPSLVAHRNMIEECVQAYAGRTR